MEERQCVPLSVAASVLCEKEGRPPSPEVLQDAALECRMELWHAAAEAIGALGEAPSLVTSFEADLRVFGHDALAPHRDEDFRYLALFPAEMLDDVCLHMWLVD